MKKILIVDDEPNIRELLYQILEDFEVYDVKIIKAQDGKRALEMVKKYVPDIIYLDIMLPEINGYDICKELKHSNEYKDIYVILLTAKGQELDKKRGLEVGADMYITKPFDPDFIVEKTSELLGIDIF